MSALPATLVRVTGNLDAVTTIGHEDDPADVGSSRADVEAIWASVRTWYALGTTPAIQVCLRRNGAIVLNRSVLYFIQPIRLSINHTPPKPSNTEAASAKNGKYTTGGMKDHTMTPHVRATSTAMTTAITFHQDAGPPRLVTGSPSVIGQPLHKAVAAEWQRMELLPLVYVEAVVR